jgi:prevent-host-death family protein
MKMVNLHAAKTHLSRLIDEAAGGEEVIIARAGRPVVRLVPFAPRTRRRKAGTLKGQIRIARNFDAPLPAAVAAAFGIKR